MIIVGTLVALPLLFMAFYMAQVPTTFGCTEFVGRSAEAKLEYPNGRQLGYAVQEGSRDLTGMSNPQPPGFTKSWELAADDREALGWFDARLQALGWKPLEVSSSPTFQQVALTSRGSVLMNGAPRPLEAISLTLRATRSPSQSASDDRLVLRFIYLITTPDQFAGC